MMTPARYLRVQFIKHLRKGYVKNAELDPVPDDNVVGCADDGEAYILKIAAKAGQRYWFTDRRVLLEREHNVLALFHYKDVCAAHWITKDVLRRAFDTPDPKQTIHQMKTDHFDRIEVELTGKSPVVFEGLGQAYSPVLSFLNYAQKYTFAG